MARSRQNNTPVQQPAQQLPVQNWWDKFLIKIGSTGGAVIVLITVAGGFFEAGRKYMENEKNIEIFDLKTAHKSKVDSLIVKHAAELKKQLDKNQEKDGKK
ncbi:hypothetical protein [Chryseobacterium aquifrigidense]|uniref:Uncharacterized protein n=1 Tax=Chryseobacterium aquifrigidense TaxID=558021 RepID=A0A543EA00_9FLAO|nr:hypothetical protein [Chryseobacterium aquifrigidense]TQM18346.1 hypothetical protein FB551_4127 [Chryseobacterium aquifrigidense]